MVQDFVPPFVCGQKQVNASLPSDGPSHQVSVSEQKAVSCIWVIICQILMTLLSLLQDPVQEWGEEELDGAVFGVTLRREPILPSLDTAELPTAFAQYHAVKVRRLKAATLERLLSHLLDPEHQEPDFIRVFLSTYKAFISSTSTLIKLLFQSPSASPLISPLPPVIRLWLEEYGEDFRDPPQYQDLRQLCVHLRHGLCFRRLAQTDLVCLTDCSESASQHNSESLQQELRDQEDGGEASTKEEDKHFMDFPVRDVAEQLTRLDAELFVRVVPFHCLGCVWSQRDKKENRNLAPTVRATISQFNAVTNRVITSLLWPPVHRARIIERWIAIAQECRQLKNFSSLRAVLSALQSNAVYRLKKTWAAVSRESMATFDLLCEIFPDENCVLTSREILVEVTIFSSGVVPYLGTYLTVLTMLDTALPDTVEGGLINFEKRRREFEIVSQIRQLQASCSNYSLPVNHHIAAWLQAHTLLTDQERMEWISVAILIKGTQLNSVCVCRLRSSSDSSLRKTHADQISVSSSGSSSLHNVAEDFSSSSMSSSSPNLSSSSSSSSHPDLSSSSLVLSPESPLPNCSPQALLPVYNKQVADSCIIRVSVECVSNGNVYKSILLTSQDHTRQVIQRALEKHNMEDVCPRDYNLCQMLNNGKELQIPDKANVFYAMCTSANYDFVLRQRWRSHRRHLGSSSSPGAQPRSRYTR
uniref:Ral guanine nucleotide dissociation stimulator-like 3a n=1 Tax=Sander lucioperca TaxID=283035 RepID=A0A8C9YC06_SANLU